MNYRHFGAYALLVLEVVILLIIIWLIVFGL